MRRPLSRFWALQIALLLFSLGALTHRAPAFAAGKRPVAAKPDDETPPAKRKKKKVAKKPAPPTAAPPKRPLTGGGAQVSSQPRVRPTERPKTPRPLPVPRAERQHAPRQIAPAPTRQPTPRVVKRPTPRVVPAPERPPRSVERPVRDPEARPRDPRRADQKPVEEGRAEWHRTVDRIGEQADGRRARGAPGARGYRRPAPAPVRAVSPIVVTMPAPVPQYDPQYEPQYAPAPLVHGAEPASPAYEAPVSAQSQGLGAAPVATGPVAPDTPPGASPLVTPPMLVPSAPAVTEEAHAASSWFQGLKLRGSFSQWDYAPIDNKPEPVFAEGRTSEVYDIEPLRLYRFDAELYTRYARIGLTYESNRGLDVGPGLGDLFGLFVAATGVPVLDRFSLVARTLDFEHGHVTLLDAQTGETVERAPFRVEMTDIDLRYAFSANGFLFGEYLGYALPRNVYLQMGNGDTEPLQISDQLLKVEQRLFSVGLGLQWPDDGEGFHGALSGSLGMGDYDLRTVNGGAFLDHGDLFGAQLGGRLGYRLPLTSTLSLGVRDELTVRWLDPLGLPDGVRRDLRGQGVDLTDLSLTFGVTELINTVTVDLTLSI